MIDYKSARYVTTLAECQTIRAAAEQLYISSPALSMYIKNLESEIGCALFSRDKNCFVPTEIGWRYISCAQRILQINREFEADLSSYLRHSQHQITIGLYKRRGISFMVPLIQSLRQSLPAVQVNFLIGSMAELERMLYAKEADYMLVTHPIHKEDFIYSHVCHDELLMVCPESLKNRTSQLSGCPYPILALADVLDLRMLLPNTSQSIYAYVSQLLESSGLHFSSTHTVANMEIAVQSAAAQMGVCFTLASYIPSFSHIPGVIFCRPVSKGCPVSWSLAYLKNQPPLSEFPLLKEQIRSQIESILESNGP